MRRHHLLFPILAGAMALSACSGGSSGSNPGSSHETAAEIFARLDCGAATGIEGPLDAVQEPLVAELGGALADVPEIGASAESVVLAVARLLDVLDAFAGSGAALFAEQDPEAGLDAFDGAGLAVQCTAKSLYEAYAFSPLAELAPTEVNALVAELAGLALAFDGAGTLGPQGLEDLTARLAGVADALANIVQILPADVGVFPDELPVESFAALTQAPIALLNNLADTLRSAGQLDGQSTADNIANTLTDLLGIIDLGVLPEEGSGALADAIMQVQEQLANGLGMILVPLFDAIASGFAGDEAGFGADIFSGFLASGLIGGDGGNPLDAFLGGGAPDGLDRLPLADLLAGVPLLGDLLGSLLGGGGDGAGDPAALLTDLILGGGGDGAPDLLGALQEAAAQLQGMVPGGLDLGDFLGDGGNPLTDLLDVLTGLLPLDGANPLDELLAILTGGGGGLDGAGGLTDLLGSLLGLLGGF